MHDIPASKLCSIIISGFLQKLTMVIISTGIETRQCHVIADAYYPEAPAPNSQTLRINPEP